MPIFEFQCEDCRDVVEIMTFSEGETDELRFMVELGDVCPCKVCEGHMKMVMSAHNFKMDGKF